METGKHGITESLRCCDVCSPVGSISPWDQGKKRHSGWSFTVLSWVCGCRKSSDQTAALHYLPCQQSQITTFHKNSQERFVCCKWMPDISCCFGPMINSPLAFCICSLVEQKSKAICKDVSPEEQNNPLILGKINESADCWMHSSHNPLIQYPLDIFSLFFHVRLSQTHLWFARRERLKGWISGHLRSVVTVFGILSWKPCWVQSLDPVIHQVLFLCKLSCQISFLYVSIILAALHERIKIMRKARQGSFHWQWHRPMMLCSFGVVPLMQTVYLAKLHWPMMLHTRSNH